jgi:hypothetical protein
MDSFYLGSHYRPEQPPQRLDYLLGVAPACEKQRTLTRLLTRIAIVWQNCHHDT